MMECPTGLLIDIDEEMQETAKKSFITPDKNKAEQAVCISEPVHSASSSIPRLELTVDEAAKPKVKLCGYLAKLSNSGFMRTSKTRWFSYDPNRCVLSYYRQPDIDVGNNAPLGDIELRRASFNFTAENLRENIFSITDDKVMHNLQACDRKTLLWWLQELQSERRIFNLQQNDDDSPAAEWHGTLLGQSLFWVPNTTNTNPGLVDVCLERKSPSPRNDQALSLNILPRIDDPPDSVGDRAAQKQRSSTMLSTSGLSTLSNRIQSFGNFAAVSNAGEAAIKGIKQHAQRLRTSNSARRTSEENTDKKFQQKSSSESSLVENISSTSNEMDRPASMIALKDKVHQQREEIELMKTKLQTKEEAIEVLKLELGKYEGRKGELPEMQQQHSFSQNDYKLRSEVISLKLDKERAEEERVEAKKREEGLQERLDMLMETLEVKDQLLVRLGNQMSELENSYKELEEIHHTLRAEKNEEFVILTPSSSGEDVDKLKSASIVDSPPQLELYLFASQDKAEGFMLQNKFLNNEILELANLRQVDGRKIQALQDKVHQQEAEHCQLHSKYLVLLSEMNKPRTESVGLAVAGTKVDTSDEDRKEMVKILIKDALADTDHAEVPSENNRRQRYDQFGFSNIPDDDAELTLLTAASRLEKRSTDILQSLHQFNTSVAIKWQNYLTVNKELQRGDELKGLVRLGVPHELRPQVWSWLVKLRTLHIRQKLDAEGSYYHQMAHSKEAQLPTKQIELDLLRTLPNNKHFSSLSSSGINQLRRVLRAYSVHNPSIGYCQGLNRIAAVALLYLCEEDAFWCLVGIVECIMPPDYYSTTLTASQADQRVFRDLMAEKLPRLHRHLETAGVDSSLITFNWLLCIYCDNVPPETMLHVWDCLLYEGSKVLFRFGLAFFKYVEEEILQLTDYMAIFNFLRVMSHRMHNTRELTQLAFNWMNPFPMRKVNRLRQVHMERVNAELQELDKIRKGFQSVRGTAPNRDLDSDDD